MATANQIQLGLKAQPYRPITIHLSDGTAFTIDHPEFAIVSPLGREMIVYEADDSANLIDMRQVVRVRVPGRELAGMEEGEPK